MSLVLIHPAPDVGWADIRLADTLKLALAGHQFQTVYTAQELTGLQGRRLLFALPLGDTGTNVEYIKMLARMRREPNLLEGCTAGLIVDANSPLYTKSAASELTLAANMACCAFLGRPLVEATGSLANFRIQARNLNTSLSGAYHAAAKELVERLDQTEAFPREREAGAAGAPRLQPGRVQHHVPVGTGAGAAGRPDHCDRDWSAQRYPVRLLRLPLHRLPPLWRKGQLLLWRCDAGRGVSRRPPV